jgi:O-antigen/teichoic acid export membrane protein
MNYFASGGMPWVTVYASAISALVNITLNFIWIPSMGIVGASLASVAGYSLMLAISLIYIHRDQKKRS